MKRSVVLLAFVSMLGAACSDSLNTATDGTPAATAATAAGAASTASSAPASTSEDSTAATEDTTEADTTTAAPTTTAAAPPAAAAAPLVPSVVCIDFNFDVYFAYDNQSDSVVVVDPADSRLEGIDPTDDPFVPTVFAPGTVSPVLLAMPTGSPDDITWTLTGPDGTTLTAAPDADTPECTSELLAPTTPDPRTPGFDTTASLSDDGSSIELTVELTGVPATSVCHAAFTPDPVTVSMRDVSTDDAFDGATVTFTRDVLDLPVGPAARFDVATFVADNCSDVGTTFRSWALGEFVPLWGGVSFCARVDGTEVEVTQGDSCGGPPVTGGARNRNG